MDIDKKKKEEEEEEEEEEEKKTVETPSALEIPSALERGGTEAMLDIFEKISALHAKHKPVPGDDMEWDIIEEKDRIDTRKAALYGPRLQIGVGAEPGGLGGAGTAGVAAGAALQIAKAAGGFGLEMGKAAGGIGLEIGRAAVGAIQAKLENPGDRLKRDYCAARGMKDMTEGSPAPKFKVRQLPKGYKYEDRLAAGGQGSVELWRKIESKQLYAAKIFDRGSHAMVDAEQEFRILEFLRKSETTCEAIIHCRSLHRNVPLDGQYTLVLENCDLGDLRKWKESLNKFSEPVAEAEVWNIFLQLTEALAVLHSGYGTKRFNNKDNPWTPIVHRDFKPQNILLKSTTKSYMPAVKLCDFGMSAFKDKNFNPKFGKRGTPQWHGPPKGIMDTPGDIFGLGATIHYLCVGMPPVDEMASGKLMKMGGDPHTYYFELPRRVIDIRSPPHERKELTGHQVCTVAWNITYSQELYDVMMLALEMDHRKRASAVQLLTRIQNYLRGRQTDFSQQLAEQKDARDGRINLKQAEQLERKDAKAIRAMVKRPTPNQNLLEWSSADMYNEVLKKIPLLEPKPADLMSFSSLPFAKYAKPVDPDANPPKPASSKQKSPEQNLP